MPDIWRAGLEINVSLVPLSLSLSAGHAVAGLEETTTETAAYSEGPASRLRLSRSRMPFLSAVGYAVFLRFSYALDRGVFDDANSAMLWIRIGMQPIFLVGGAIASVWFVMWLSGTWRAERSWIDRSGRALDVYWILLSVFFGWSVFPCGVDRTVVIFVIDAL